MKYLLVLFLLSIFNVSAGLNIDSLKQIWHDNAQHDTVRLNAIFNMAWDGYMFSEPEIALIYADSMYHFAKIRKYDIHMAKALNIKGISCYFRSEYEHALEHYNEALEIRKKLENNEKGIAALLNNIAMVHFDQGEYNKSIEILTQALTIEEKLGNDVSVASSLGNIGLIYREQDEYEMAISYYKKSLKMLENYPDELTYISNALSNLGVIYLNTEQPELALENFIECEKIQTELNDLNGLAQSYHNIGTVYHLQKEFSKALAYLKKGLELELKVGNKVALASTNHEIARIFFKQGDYNSSEKHAWTAYEYAIKHRLPVERSKSSLLLHDLYKISGQYKKALEMYEVHISTRDSLKSEENKKEIIRQEYKYKYEKQAETDSLKAAEQAKMKDAQIEIEKAKNKEQKLRALLLMIGLILSVIIAVIILFSLSQNRKKNTVLIKKNEEIKIKNEEINTAYHEIEKKNIEITDSIQYAKRIQSAILPSKKVFKEYLKESFILYKPKDIVAGDFYWLEHIEDKLLIAVCDCTGHGVPGAMVSVVCNNGLNRAVREHDLSVPGNILDKTREIVLAEFEKSEEDVKDGMDVALVSLKLDDKSVVKLEYAGAHNPLWIIRNGSQEVEEIKADKQPIGQYYDPKPYQTHSTELEKGDSLYIFSDGYSDQFGGEKGKKFKSTNFKKLLLSIQNESMDNQKELIIQNFEDWRGDIEQLDDICIIGVRV